MIEAEQHCADVLRQTYSVRRAIEQLESKLVAGHLHHCVMEGAERSNDSTLEEVVEVCDLAFRSRWAHQIRHL
jgi:CsoR family transcriptional regulator, copper-sensing transcriptional repressor